MHRVKRQIEGTDFSSVFVLWLISRSVLVSDSLISSLELSYASQKQEMHVLLAEMEVYIKKQQNNSISRPAHSHFAEGTSTKITGRLSIS
jgi:hypothetical protein